MAFVHLDTPSSFLTTFNTHKACYQFLHMSFGLKMSQDVFQMQMDQITDRLPGIIAIHDDICVYGKDTTEHDKNLLKFMQTAQDHGLVFNSNKCSIHQPQISFYGAIFTVQGMKPDPAKVQALQDLPAPKPKTTQVLFRPSQLLAALPPWPCFQDHFPLRASNKLGLESLH